MSFNTSLSGLNAASNDLGVISNNVANASTIGFKESRAEFADVYATSALGSSSTAIGSGVLLNSVSQQFKQGNLEFTDNSLDLAVSGEGFFVLHQTQNEAVTSYTRAGAFQVDADGFVVTAGGEYLQALPVNEDGTTTSTSISSTENLQLPQTAGSPSESAEIEIGANFDANALAKDPDDFDPEVSSSYSSSTSITTYDSLGNSHVATMYFLRDSTDGTDAAKFQTRVDSLGLQTSAGTALTSTLTFPSLSMTAGATTITVDLSDANALNLLSADLITNNISAAGTDISTLTTTEANEVSQNIVNAFGGQNMWAVFLYVDDIPQPITNGFNPTSALVTPPEEYGLISFDTTGGYAGSFPPEIVADGIIPVRSTEDPVANGANILNLALDFENNTPTQFASPFNITRLSQDGATTGRLTGLDIAADGVVRATYSNGEQSALGRVALANFANPQALKQLGNTSWYESLESGPPLVGEAGTGSFGNIQSGALESSNVDLTGELVKLITAQRNFQANAKAIETHSAVTQAVLQLR